MGPNVRDNRVHPGVHPEPSWRRNSLPDLRLRETRRTLVNSWKWVRFPLARLSPQASATPKRLKIEISISSTATNGWNSFGVLKSTESPFSAGKLNSISTSNSHSQRLDRLVRDRPDLLGSARQGELSVHQAAVEADIIRDSSCPVLAVLDRRCPVCAGGVADLCVRRSTLYQNRLGGGPSNAEQC